MKRTHVLGVLLLVLSSCTGAAPGDLTGGAGSGGGAGSAGGGTNIPFTNIAEAELAARCEYGVRCGLYPNRAACESSYVPLIRQRIYDVTKGITQYDGVAYAKCLDELAHRVCTVTDSLAPRSQACRDAFKGTQPGGGNCHVNYECASGGCFVEASCINLGLTCCQGTCGDGVTVANGAACLSNQSCGPDAVCKSTTSSTSGVCTARLGVGQSCIGDECMPGLFCLADPAGGPTSSCRALPARGEACDPEQYPCDGLLDRCDPVTHVCGAAPGPGAACAGEDSCISSATCNTSPMTCLAKSAAGGACRTADDCLGNATCEGNTCKRAVDPIPCTLLR